jgi:hypothetical protein
LLTTLFGTRRNIPRIPDPFFPDWEGASGQIREV